MAVRNGVPSWTHFTPATGLVGRFGPEIWKRSQASFWELTKTSYYRRHKMYPVRCWWSVGVFQEPSSRFSSSIATALDRISGPKHTRIVSSMGLGFGTITGRAHFLQVQALDLRPKRAFTGVSEPQNPPKAWKSLPGLLAQSVQNISTRVRLSDPRLLDTPSQKAWETFFETFGDFGGPEGPETPVYRRLGLNTRSNSGFHVTRSPTMGYVTRHLQLPQHSSFSIWWRHRVFQPWSEEHPSPVL